MEKPNSENTMDSLRDTLNETKKLWWLHDSYWHATVVRELGEKRANELNLEANERFFRKYAQMLLRSRVISRPENITELMDIFRLIWADCFFDDMYVHDPIAIEGDEAVWVGRHCHAFTSLDKGNMTEGYACGCQAIRNGVMKALNLKPLHAIEKSLVAGDGQCVIRLKFEKK